MWHIIGCNFLGWRWIYSVQGQFFDEQAHWEEVQNYSHLIFMRQAREGFRS